MTKESKLYRTENLTERVILIAVERDNQIMNTNSCLEELEELVQTAGAIVIGRLVQKRESIHRSLYFGKGKLEELKIMIAALDATGIICDDELSPAQMKNLEEKLETKIMDRTMLILDIFAGRAVSREGKIQVELAQLRYRLSRLTGIGKSLSRLGGGIGTRGPGETKLEADRRYIKDRISELTKEAKEISSHRELLRIKRAKQASIIVSLVGYTNAGKSTILNKLTDAGVLAEDKLFATLDTTTRKVKLPNGSEILLTDTVGFIQKLPHHLIQAFRATLEELKYADICLHVVDASNPARQEHIQVVYETIKDLGVNDTPIITIFNKMDKEVEVPLPVDHKAWDFVRVSAKTGEGIKNMLITIETLLKTFRQPLKALIPYTDGALINQIHGSCEILSEEHLAEGILIEAFVNEEMKNRLEIYTMVQ